MNAPIGIFDSGMGGLTVAKAVKQLLPHEDIIYFGDTAHFPYGDKSASALKAYSKKITRFLLDKGCKVILIACNSASSAAFEEVKHMAEGKAFVLDVINPVIAYASYKYDAQTIGLIGTKRTISSNSYYLKLQASNPSIHLKSLATPLFAPMIEEGFASTDVSKKVIEAYLSDERTQGIAALILGCTHYPLIKKEIDLYYQNKIDVIDSSDVIAQTLLNQLKAQNRLNSEKHKASYEFYVSDYTASFETSTKVFFGEQVILEQVDLHTV